jgi:hypothetical protein
MWAIELIKKLINDKFYGKVELSFEAGKIVLVKKTETLKP